MFIRYAILTLFCMIQTPSYSRPQSATFHGKTTIKDAVYDTITVNGHFDFDTLRANTITTHGHTSGKNIVAELMVVHGYTTLLKGKLSTLTTHGFTELTDIDIKQFISHGKLVLSHCSVDKLESHGKCEIYNCRVKKECELTTQQGVIKNSTIECNITLHKSYSHTYTWSFFNWFSPSEPAEEILKLQGTTHVTGDIIFESGKGKVYIEDKAIVQGKIIGGTVINSK